MNNNFSLNTTVWLLTMFFVILKISGQVTWSWVWVLSPLWITGSAMLLATGVIIALILLKVVSMKDIKDLTEKEKE